MYFDEDHFRFYRYKSYIYSSYIPAGGNTQPKNYIFPNNYISICEWFLFKSYKCTEAMSKNDKINTTNLTINIALVQRLKSFSSFQLYPILFCIHYCKCNYYAAMRITWTRKTINILKQIKVQICFLRLWLWKERLTLMYSLCCDTQFDWNKIFMRIFIFMIVCLKNVCKKYVH